jgi:hypothetical protein
VLLLALGIPILIASLNVVEYKVPYAFEGPFAGRDAAERQSLLWSAPDDTGVQYTVPILVDQRMEPPVRLRLGVGWQRARCGAMSGFAVGARSRCWALLNTAGLLHA